MTHSRREVLNLLHKALTYVEGTGHSDVGSSESHSMFLDSPVCPNRNDIEHKIPCAECWFFNFVPERFREELPSCHFIPLNYDGETLHSIGRDQPPAEVKEKLKIWLKAEIRHLEDMDMAEGAIP